MSKKIDNFIDKLRASDREGGAVLFNFISILSLCAILIAVITTYIENIGTKGAIGAYAAGIFLVIIFIAGHKTKKYDFWSFILLLLLNVGVVPAAYFGTGGYNSGMPMWMILCLVGIFYLLKGKLLAIAATIAAIVDTGCFVVSHLHPEYVTNFESENYKFFDVFVATAVIGTLICAFMRIQNHLYTHELKENVEQQKELEAALKSQSLFLANMSHEIRTPINTIIGLNEMTLREDISDEVAENSENIKRASKMLLSLINDVLDLSKVEAGKMELVEVEYHSGDMFSDIVNTNWMRAQSKGLEFRIVISPTLPSVLYGDDSKIKQVIANFLSNAIKYTKSGSVTLSVDSEPIDDENINVKIEVIDTGMGIKKDDLKSLFDDFKRVNEQDTRGIEGTGLGLAICKQLVELMHGEITVDSIYGKGSTFGFSIPQRVVNTKPIGEIKKGSFSNRERAQYERSFEAPDAKVLVVDDNEMNLLVAKKLLRETKVKVELARSGDECLRHTLAEEYDVILMDHLMPGMDGVETLEKLRDQKNGYCSKTPVIALTANAMAGAKETYRKYGFTDYLSKPINGASLEQMLLTVLPPDKVEYQKALSDTEKIHNIKIVNKERKRRVAIATDSASDIPPYIMKQLGINIISHYLETDSGLFQDMKEIYTENVLDYIEKGREVRAIPPSVEEYENFFGDLLAKAENVIYLSTTANADYGYERARKAAESFAHVAVLDSGHLSSGLGIMTIEAAKLAIEERTVEEIIEHLKNYEDNVASSFVLQDTSQMTKTALVAKPVDFLARLIGLHPVVEIINGKITPTRIYRGDMSSVYLRYTRYIMKKYKDIDDSLCIITHSSVSNKDLERVKKEVLSQCGFEQIFTIQAASSIAAHCGPGCLGVLFIHK